LARKKYRRPAGDLTILSDSQAFHGYALAPALALSIWFRDDFFWQAASAPPLPLPPSPPFERRRPQRWGHCQGLGSGD